MPCRWEREAARPPRKAAGLTKCERGRPCDPATPVLCVLPTTPRPGARRDARSPRRTNVPGTAALPGAEPRAAQGRRWGAAVAPRDERVPLSAQDGRGASGPPVTVSRPQEHGRAETKKQKSRDTGHGGRTGLSGAAPTVSRAHTRVHARGAGHRGCARASGPRRNWEEAHAGEASAGDL